MKTIYLYVLDTLADWEIGHVMSELHSKRFFKQNASNISIKTVSHSKNVIQTMGGINIVPDLLVEEIVIAKENLLLLPGGETWGNAAHHAILHTAEKFISAGATVGAICGATVALADQGMLDQHPHTSNGIGFLDMFSPKYKGQDFYLDQPSVSAGNLITAGPTSSLLWTKQIIEQLDVFNPASLDAWYNYFSTGEAAFYFELMQTLSADDER